MSGGHRNESLKMRVVYQVPGMDEVVIQQNTEYRTVDDVPLVMDVYYPPGVASESRFPAVIFVSGYADSTIIKMLGVKLKEMGQYTRWGRLAAASGLVALVYEAKAPDIDIQELIGYVRHNAALLKVDENRIGIWSCSGNVPTALSVLMKDPRTIKCAVLYYGYMLDWDDSRLVAEAAERVGFVNPCEGKTFDDLPQDVPMFIARAGRDDPSLNKTIEHFLSEALSRNMPIVFANHRDGRHAFDVLDDTVASRAIIRQTLQFMQTHLC